jgi:hypothetical protein
MSTRHLPQSVQSMFSFLYGLSPATDICNVVYFFTSFRQILGLLDIDTLLLPTSPCCRNTTGRAQRASARSQNGSMTLLDPSVEAELVSASIFAPLSVDVEPYTMVVDDESSISRSNSLVNVQDGISANSTGRSRRKDKGKAKETESSIFRVKEEPQSISLHSPEPPINAVRQTSVYSSFLLLKLYVERRPLLLMSFARCPGVL